MSLCNSGPVGDSRRRTRGCGTGSVCRAYGFKKNYKGDESEIFMLAPSRRIDEYEEGTGSPGLEVSRQEHYQVLSFDNDGKTAICASH